MVFSLKIRVTYFLAMIATVTAVAQEPPAASEPETVQAQQAEQKQAEEEADEVVPEIIESTEEVSEDYSIEFPVDI